MIKVLITNARQRKTLAAIRSLGEKGIEVVACDEYKLAPAFYSKYCDKWKLYPGPKKYPNLFRDWLYKEVKSNKYDILIPMDDDVIENVLEIKEKLSKYIIVPLVDKDKYFLARDKANTINIALNKKIPCPKTFFVSDISDLEYCLKELSFPVVIKPRRSSGSRGIIYARNKEELYSGVSNISKLFGWPIIQEYIPPGGAAYGVEMLFNKNSELEALFMHKRLREFPPTGGPSTFRESIYEPELADMAIKLMKSIAWYGVAMVEFKVDPRDNIPKLMEINPRFWGSLALAIYSGVDFPYFLVKIALGEKISPINDYKRGLKCRWLEGDIINFIKDKNKFTWARSFFNFFDKNIKYDEFYKDDIRPVFFIFIFYLSRLFDNSFIKDRIR